jgi:hypothetical protein
MYILQQLENFTRIGKFYKKKDKDKDKEKGKGA